MVQGDKNIIKFDGDHNSPRPQFYYDSITIFFYNILRPPDVPEVVPEAPEPIYFDDVLDMDDVDEVRCPASYILVFLNFAAVTVANYSSALFLKLYIASLRDFGMSHFLYIICFRISSMRCWGQYDHLPLPILGRLLLVVPALMVLYGTAFISMFVSLIYFF